MSESGASRRCGCGISECTVGMGRLDEGWPARRHAQHQRRGKASRCGVLSSGSCGRGARAGYPETLARGGEVAAQWDLYASLTTDLPEICRATRRRARRGRLREAASAARRHRLDPGGLANAAMGGARCVSPLLYRTSTGFRHPDHLVRIHEELEGRGGIGAAERADSAGPAQSLQHEGPLLEVTAFSGTSSAPDPKSHPEWVCWLRLAPALRLAGDRCRIRRAAFCWRITRRTTIPIRRIGYRPLPARALFGGRDAQLAKSSDLRSGVAYYLGVRPRAAIHDLRVVSRHPAETDQSDGGQALAMNTLAEWATTGQGTRKLSSRRANR